MNKKILWTKEITKSFINGNRKTTILDHISVEFYEKDFTVIMGPSGAGKSTFLYTISGMEQVTSGQVFYQNRELTNLKEKQMAGLRAGEFGFVFQQANLVSNLTLEENICVSGYLKRRRFLTGKKEINNLAERLLQKMNLTDARNRLPSECSGGEAQRAAVARAVINTPTILFADEPTGALNKQNTLEVLNLLGDLHTEGHSIIMVTHDVHTAMRGNRILYLEDGQIKGEKSMDPYLAEHEKEREEDILRWLSSMEW